MVKRIIMIASVLLIVGIIGTLLTIKTQIKEVGVLKDQMVDVTDINNVDVFTDNAEITLLSTDDEKAKVELLGNDENHLLTVDTEGDTLNVHLKTKRKLFSFNLFSKLSLKVYVPEKHYNEIVVKSNNGRVQISDLQSNEITLDNDNGRIQLTNIQSDTLLAGTKNGKIELKNIASSMVKVKSNNGKIIMENVDGEIVGETDNGLISLIADHIDRPINLSADNGKIDIQSENEPTNVILDLKTSNGKIKVYGERDWHTVIGDGENLIKLTTSNGNITINLHFEDVK